MNRKTVLQTGNSVVGGEDSRIWYWLEGSIGFGMAWVILLGIWCVILIFVPQRLHSAPLIFGVPTVGVVIWVGLACMAEQREQQEKERGQELKAVVVGGQLRPVATLPNFFPSPSRGLPTGDLLVGTRLLDDMSWPPRKWNKAQMPVDGPYEFVERTRWAMDILRMNVPHRYQDVMTYLPQIVFDPQEVEREAGRPFFGAYASGHWGTLGNPHWFIASILHETGHNMDHVLRGSTSEESANSYADTVISELAARGVHI